MNYDDERFGRGYRQEGEGAEETTTVPRFMEDEPERPRRATGISKKKSLRKKHMRNMFIAGFICGTLFTSIISLLWPEKKPQEGEKPPVIEEPIETPVETPMETPVETPVEPEKEPGEVMEGRNHANLAEKYAYDIEEVQTWMKEGRSDPEKIVFLTFDDGPGKFTEEILDVLKEKEVPGNFFLLGMNAEKYGVSSELWKRYMEEGHGLALHSYSHDYVVLYKERTPIMENITAEWEKSITILKERLGEDFNTRVFRFPGGSMSWRNMAEVKSQLAEKNIFDMDWNAITGDTETREKRPKSAEEAWTMIQDGLMRTAHPETVMLLMHDSKEDTAKFLGELIDKFKEEGYKFGILY